MDKSSIQKNRIKMIRKISNRNKKQPTEDFRKLPFKIFLFEKNEIDIIKDWVEYHAKIVGFDNIVIIDHKSNDGTFDVLKTYKDLKLIRFTGPYTSKGSEMTKQMNTYSDKASLYIPMDADEFLITHRNNKISNNPQHILEDLHKMNKICGVGRFIFSKIYNFINTKSDFSLKEKNFFRLCDYENKENRQLPKSFFCSKFFISTDMGNHTGSISTNSTDRLTNKLGLLHYQIRGLKHFKTKTVKSAKAFRYNSVRPVLNMGRHWKNDHDLLKKSGGEKAFNNKYIVKDFTNLVKYNLFESYLDESKNEND